MPLHLLGKKSWNVYNPANIAKVKADEAAAAAREAADEQRMQELDAERRAAILRGQTPPPLPSETAERDERRSRKSDKDRDGHDRKRRRLAGEDDTDRDLRLARVANGPQDDDNVAVLKLRKPKSDAPLIDHAGNINLFPVDLKEGIKREKSAEAEKEKKRKERELEDQYTMRFSNAAGRDGLEQSPWYTVAGSKPRREDAASEDERAEVESKNVWGRPDPQRKERDQARMTSNDPLAFMNRAQVQLKKSKEDKKKWVEEKDRELRELRAAEEREDRRVRHRKRKKRAEDDEDRSVSMSNRHHERKGSGRHRNCYRSRSRSRSRERRSEPKPSHRRDRSRSREADRDRRSERNSHSSGRENRSTAPEYDRHRPSHPLSARHQ